MIVGIIIAVVVVLVACSVGGLVLVNQAGNLTSTVGTATATTGTGATATPSETVLFQNALTSSSPDMAQTQHCTFGADGYHVKQGFICFVGIGDQSDVHIKVTVKQTTGALNEPYGISFRAGDGTDYEFDIDSGGSWVSYKCDGTTCSKLVDYTDTDTIHGGLNSANTLEVTAVGGQFEFSINGTPVGHAQDSAYTSGRIGLFCSDTLECVFTNLTISKPAA